MLKLKLKEKVDVEKTIEAYYKADRQDNIIKRGKYFCDVYGFFGIEKRKVLNRKIEELISSYENEVKQKLLIVNGTVRRWSREERQYIEFFSKNMPSIYKLYILENLRNSTCISSFEAMSEEIKKLMASEYNSKDEKMAIVIEIVNLKQKLRKEMFESALNISKNIKDFCCYLSERKIRFCSIKNESVYSLGGIFCEEKTAGEYTKKIIKEVLDSIIPEVGIVGSVNANIVEISSYLEKEFVSVSFVYRYEEIEKVLRQRKKEKEDLEILFKRITSLKLLKEDFFYFMCDNHPYYCAKNEEDEKKLTKKEIEEIEDFILTVIKDKLDKLVFKK